MLFLSGHDIARCIFKENVPIETLGGIIWYILFVILTYRYSLNGNIHLLSVIRPPPLKKKQDPCLGVTGTFIHQIFDLHMYGIFPPTKH